MKVTETGREREKKYCRNFVKYFNIVDEIYIYVSYQ